MLFYKMSKNDNNIRNNPIFSGIFQHRENYVHFSEIKKLSQSEKPLQSLTATNCTSNVQECTRVHYFVRIRTLFKRRIL